MPCRRIVFYTFRGCMSFYTGSTHLGHAAPFLEYYSPAVYEPLCGEGAASKSYSTGGHAMKMKRADMLIGMTVLAIAVSLLAIPTSHAQKPTGMSRVGWLEVCGPGPRRPNLEIFRGRLAELGYV